MKQVAYSLLTLLSTPFNVLSSVLAPRDNAIANGNYFTPFFAFPGNADKCCALSLGFSCPPRSLVRSRLGEGRIRNLFHRIQFVLFLFVVASAAAPFSRAASGFVINLKNEASTGSAIVCLKDIADLSGPDPIQIEKLGRINLINVPAFGDATILGKHQIREMVEKQVGHLPAEAFAGAAAVQIRMQGRQVTEEEIASILKSHLLSTTNWKESELFIRCTGSLKGIEIPPAESELRVSSNSAIIKQKYILAPIEILHAGKSVRNFWINAEISVRTEVLTAAQRIPSGKVITPDDVTLQNVEITDLRGSYFRQPENILGKVSRRVISPGDPLMCESFAEPILVKSGETVRLRLQREGIVLTSLAKAEQDGRLGQMIRVRNIDFSTILRAQVTGKAEVKLQ